MKRINELQMYLIQCGEKCATHKTSKDNAETIFGKDVLFTSFP